MYDFTSAKVRAHTYGARFGNTLRKRDGTWRRNAKTLINDELGRFVGKAIAFEFVPLDMWEYWQLVEEIDEYLRHMDNPSLTGTFYVRVLNDLRGINELLTRVKKFDAKETRSMREVFEQMASTISGWGHPI